jgi:hypothetical protein
MIPRRLAGVSLALAAATFWLSWWLMPGVGVVDAGVILDLVSARRPWVVASVIAQLVSAALFAPGLLGVAALARARSSRLLEWAAVILLVGAMGSAADAIFHIAAYEMTDPSAPRAAMLPVMERLQTAGLRFLIPLVLAYFAGSIALATGMARVGVVPRLYPALAWIGLALLPVSARFAQGVDTQRLLALAGLGLLSASTCWAGIALAGARD